eukprot:TRINITY_DN73253_c0_g1_i2.p1 TRINITY_DN73253_c0_g1~~TRINITY_DN73253_c0_g1_i2.p1  ORF type:complete len:347 (-),score=69.76 TRINITY_DN73253_c0_g1_i2:325-1365(-)
MLRLQPSVTGVNSPAAKPKARCSSALEGAKFRAGSAPVQLSGKAERLSGAGAIASSCAVAGTVLALHRQGRRRARTGTSRRAAVADTQDCRAVRSWLDKMVVGMDFCPWAAPADEAGGLRLVASTAACEEDVLRDLASEANLLAEQPDSQASTTLVVCSGVEKWTDFEAFEEFYREELQNGYALCDLYDMKIVAFHPKFRRRSLKVRPGDKVSLAGPDGITVIATVLPEEDWEQGDCEEQSVAVATEDGEEFDVGVSMILRVYPADAGHSSNSAATEQDDASLADEGSLVMRAPRPVLHLLRLADLDRASDVKGGEDPAKKVMRRNKQKVRELGELAIGELLNECG